jgi:5-(carboxyamino)imidazole ribonucleotide synthase
VIRPGATVGILGGGQLGRMLALAAAEYGLKTHVYTPEADSPAFAVSCRSTCAPYEDEAALIRFARDCDVVTYEFENVPRRTAEIVGSLAPLFPDAGALATTQDRLSEKTFVAGLGIATAPFRAVSSEDELRRALAALGPPAVLKTRRFGYDGKGQVMIGPDAEPWEIWAAMHHAPCILEGFVPFEREISVVAARSADGAFAAYDVCANTHRCHILDVTRVPAGISTQAEAAALDIARRIAEALGYVGVLAVEMFLVREGGAERVVVNEIAPRVHNSGHWTIEGAVTSQFAQHVRAVCGWPLGSTRRLGAVEMRNLIGDDADAWAALLADPEAHVHLYGKGEARPGRKMGHVTRLSPSRGGPTRPNGPSEVGGGVGREGEE